MPVRPFYIIGHNTNSIQQVLDTLSAGGNAVEPDIQIYASDPTRLCVSHDVGGSDAPPLPDFLRQLAGIAIAHPELALIELDCKSEMATAAHGQQLLDAINSAGFPSNLSIVISVAFLKDANLFKVIVGQLGPQMGLMIDEGSNNPVDIKNFFASIGVTSNGYGNGISVLNDILGPNVRPSMERACELRAASGFPRFINTWSVQDAELQREYIRIGVDSIITDEVAQLRHIVDTEMGSMVRLATRGDSPWKRPNFRYGLTVRTLSVSAGGTDANVTFTLTGEKGSARKTVDTSWRARMEAGQTNYVTIESLDLGMLSSVSVQRDGSGIGPDWFLDTISVGSDAFEVAATATFNRWIDSTATFSASIPAYPQPAWRYCFECQGMFFGGVPGGQQRNGLCPATGAPHDPSASGRYSIRLGGDSSVQQGGWRRCSKCQGVFFGLQPGQGRLNGVCAADGEFHDPTGSKAYAMVWEASAEDQQHGWRWCWKCQGLFFAGLPTTGPRGTCPADYKAHDPSGSGRYAALVTPVPV